MTAHMPYVYDDGGRSASGRKGFAGDCVCRAIAIAADLPYEEVYRRLAEGNGGERTPKPSRHTYDSAKINRRLNAVTKRGRTARSGIHVKRTWFKKYMHELGFVWVATMGVGTGCKVHLAAGELPAGRLVVSVSKHYTAVVDGVVRDTHNPQRSTIWYEHNVPVRTAQRCVYGYWSAK